MWNQLPCDRRSDYGALYRSYRSVIDVWMLVRSRMARVAVHSVCKIVESSLDACALVTISIDFRHTSGNNVCIRGVHLKPAQVCAINL
eukprot:SAG31_NODE_801_length_12013_cov_23.812070_18_plen_88_part_00